MNTTITFKTDKKLKEDASKLFESMGLSLSSALNIFMKQAVINNSFPLCIDNNALNDNILKDYLDITNYFGKGNDLGFDEEPEEIVYNNDNEEELLINC